MTHTESQDLLLDLAYGELPAHVAAEVSQHLEGCADCQAEQAQLSGVRSAFAPIHELEEPSNGFDDRILAAARAEAMLEHDGNIGQVIEGAGSIAPLGLAAASVDAHAAPAPARRKPKWMMRAVLSGSAAAAAALALVVGISRPTHLAQPPSEEYAIRVQPQAPAAPMAGVAPGSAEGALDRKAAQAPAPTVQAPPAAELHDVEPHNAAPPATVAQLSKGQVPSRRAAEPKKKKASEPAVDQGSGGDVPTQRELALAGKPAAKQPTDNFVAGYAPPPPPAAEKEAPAQLDAQNVIVTGSNIRRRDAKDEAASGAAASAPSATAEFDDSSKAPDAEQQQGIPEASLPPARAASSVARAAKAAVPPSEDPIDLEHRAETARHDGNYALAAGLYREAASSHHYNSKAAAWDLAHAVECLAASGSFDEARNVRDQLQRVFPTEITAFAAARRALREVDVSPSK
ncbi:MAG TPA: zf-HC2 domain-containing protein [Myxococcales bacterium]|jgi:hypothetical protein|nr:zf-HC2 domain-containing protein [Myxococcales bacterium]